MGFSDFFITRPLRPVSGPKNNGKPVARTPNARGNLPAASRLCTRRLRLTDPFRMFVFQKIKIFRFFSLGFSDFFITRPLRPASGPENHGKPTTRTPNARKNLPPSPVHPPLYPAPATHYNSALALPKRRLGATGDFRFFGSLHTRGTCRKKRKTQQPGQQTAREPPRRPAPTRPCTRHSLLTTTTP